MLLLSGLLSVPLTALASTSMSNEQASALLDYHMDNKVEAAMRARLQDNPEDGNAWHYLSLALRAQGKASQADAAKDNAARFGLGERDWHIDLRMSGFVDSNVVVVPNALNLAARDRGDIGARIHAVIAGTAFDQGWTHTDWSLAYADMLYQDFSAFALRQMQAGLTQHLDIGDSAGLWIGAHGEQASLGGKRLFVGWNAVGGTVWQPNDNNALNLDLSFGHRNFLSGYGAFTAWRGKASPSWSWQGDGLKATLGGNAAREQTHSGEEAYRQIGASADAGWRILEHIGHGDIWVESGAGFDLRNYQQTNSQPFLIRPLKRRDTQLKLIGSISWKRSVSMWSEKAGETWKFQAGWMRNRSNIDRTAVFDVAQSRDWRRWWTEASIQWHY